MRVAHIMRKYDPAQWGGTETAIERLTAGFSGQGVDSVVYAPRLADAVTVADPLVAAGCEVRRFRAFVPVWGISADQKRQMVSVGGNVMSFDLLGALWREPRLDVIHSHALGRLGAVGRVVARGRGLPFVLSVHGGAYDLPAVVRAGLSQPTAGGWDWGKPLGFLLRARKLFSEADAIITVNAREAELIRERHPDRRVVVQPHGVPAARFARDCRAEARAAFPVVNGRPVLLVLGRIDPVKNQEWLIAQAAELVRRHPTLLLVFVGAFMDVGYGEALRARVTREGLDGNVWFAGNLPPGDARLIGLLQEARAVVLPSASETFGIVILEAWAAGTPVISSRTSGAMALVEEGVNGWMFALESPAGFHAAVDQLLAEPGRGVALGAAGRAKVGTDYDTAVLAGRVKRLYGELIEANHAHRHPARR
jgi:starch synthase